VVKHPKLRSNFNENTSASTSKFFSIKETIFEALDSRMRVKSTTCAPTNVLPTEKTFWLAHYTRCLSPPSLILCGKERFSIEYPISRNQAPHYSLVTSLHREKRTILRKGREAHERASTALHVRLPRALLYSFESSLAVHGSIRAVIVSPSLQKMFVR
jgi:hypothetical protein